MLLIQIWTLTNTNLNLKSHRNRNTSYPNYCQTFESYCDHFYRKSDGDNTTSQYSTNEGNVSNNNNNASIVVQFNNTKGENDIHIYDKHSANNNTWEGCTSNNDDDNNIIMKILNKEVI